MPNKHYKISKAAEILGVSASCLRRWDNDGKVNSWRSPGGHRYFDISSIRECDVAAEKSKSCPRTILYSRVSSSKQRDDLQRQQSYIKNNHLDKHPRSGDVLEITDIASGLNFKRPGLLRILGLVKEGDISTIVVASRDRLARFGFELIEWLCGQYGTKIVVLDNDDSTPEEELGKDLMSIVQVYCCRWNGRRRYANGKDIEVAVEADPRTEANHGKLGTHLEVHIQHGSELDFEARKHTQGKHPDAKQVGGRKRQGKRKDEQLRQSTTVA